MQTIHDGVYFGNAPVLSTASQYGIGTKREAQVIILLELRDTARFRNPKGRDGGVAITEDVDVAMIGLPYRKSRSRSGPSLIKDHTK